MQVIHPIIEEINKSKYETLFRFLNERIENPENFVVLLGETSSGKTTLLNGLLQDQLFLTSARPTTGTVIELMDQKSAASYHFYAVNKDATLETITENMFHELAKNPDQDLERLRIITPTFPHGLKNLRLFDTPGYGSLHEEHEQILKEFIPNSDIIVYVVSYRIGFKENDHYFMNFIQEMIDKNTAFYLVINRVPEGVNVSDNRIKEIQLHAQDCLHRNLNCYLVPAQIPAEENKHVLPQASDLWKDLRKQLETPERMEALARAFFSYQNDLLLELKGNQEQKFAFAKASAEQMSELQATLEEFLRNEEIIIEKIRGTFAKLYPKLDKLLDLAMTNINDNLISEIEKANRWTSKDECVGFIQSHLLPLQIQKETKGITDYLQVELERLDDEINSILNTAIQKFEAQISLKLSIFEPIIMNLSNRMGQKMAGKALAQFFKQFGGAGGAGAGVANAAKKGLKAVGKVFGKTFSRETHNGLAKFLSRIGATSTKAISAAAAVIVEGLFYLYDSYKWKIDLGKQIKKATLEWKKETLDKVTKDMHELEEHNLQSIHSYFEEYQELKEVPEEEISSFDLNEITNRISRIDDLLTNYTENFKEVHVHG